MIPRATMVVSTLITAVLLSTSANSAESQVSFRSYHETYLVAENNGGETVNANRGAIGAWERFTLHSSNSRCALAGDGDLVSIRSGNGHYFSAQPGGALDANRTALGPWEKFQIKNHSRPGNCIQHEDVVSLKGYHNRYVVAEQSGGANANRSAVGPWERFAILLHHDIAGVTPAHGLAQGCYALQHSGNKNYVLATGSNSYGLGQVNEQKAERFFLKPTGLGTFLLYDRDGGFFSMDASSTKRNWSAGASSEWKIAVLKKKTGETVNRYTLVSTENSKRLSVFGSQLSVVSDVGTSHPFEPGFYFLKQPVSACKSFPEASLDATVSPEFHKPKDPRRPVTGWADQHTHIAFPKALGAMAMSGDVFHRFGIEQALADCSELHGNNGEMDLLGSQVGSEGHSTAGYPAFTSWPNRHPATHVHAYYRWIQRAYLSGLRLMVTYATGNKTFCELLDVLHRGKRQGDCSSDSLIELQTRYIYDLQKYIDAQEGGVGKGWFRVVTSPQQARQVISQNKIAVLLGVEYNTLFDCNTGASHCTVDYMNRKFEELYDLGIRVVFPIHRFDNAFGGTIPQGDSSGAWMNLTNKMNTGKIHSTWDLLDPTKLLFTSIGGNFWELEECPSGIRGTSNIMSMEEFINNDFKTLSNLVTSIPVVGGIAGGLFNSVFVNKLKPLPKYEKFNVGGRACNVRGLQDKGRHLIRLIMDHGMILEVDHMSYPTLLQTLDLLESRQYSGVVSSHDWMEDNVDLRGRIFSLGGIVAPMSVEASRTVQTIQRYAQEMERYPYHIGVGVGSDTQGLATMPASDRNHRVTYPFESYDGTVTFTQPKTGNRVFDFNKEGVSNYGLFAEWVESLNHFDRVSDRDIMGVFMNSAEAYLQMWERAQGQ